MAHADRGIFVSRDTARVLVKDNQFEDVAQPVLDEVAEQKAAEAKLARYLGRKEPVAVWDFDERLGESSPTPRATVSPPPRWGKSPWSMACMARRFGLDGASYLRVAEPAVFNAPELTVSLWVKPEQLKGRRGIVAKRFSGTSSTVGDFPKRRPCGFEAATPDGKWPWNFQHRSGACREDVDALGRGDGAWSGCDLRQRETRCQQGERCGPSHQYRTGHHWPRGMGRRSTERQNARAVHRLLGRNQGLDKGVAGRRDSGRVQHESAREVAGVPGGVANGRVFLGTGDGQVVCLSAENGEVQWTAEIGEPIAFQPAVANGQIYVSAGNGASTAWKRATRGRRLVDVGGQRCPLREAAIAHGRNGAA